MQPAHDCIVACSECHDTCVATVRHGLKIGGAHADADHVRALLDCAQACDSSRDFMLRLSDLYPHYCAACAEACERCASSCRAIGGDDDVMLECAEMCRACAESCRNMAGGAA